MAQVSANPVIDVPEREGLPDDRPPNDYNDTRASPASFGGEIAQGTKELGQGTLDLNKYWGGIQVDDASNNAQKEGSAFVEHIRTLQGQDALDAQKTAGDQLEKIYNNRRSQVPPGLQVQFDNQNRPFFDRYLRGQMNTTFIDAGRQFADQTANSANEVAHGMAATAGSDNNWATVEVARAKALGAQIKLLQQKGLENDPDARETARQKADLTYKSAIEGLALKDPDAAQARLEDPKIKDALSKVTDASGVPVYATLSKSVQAAVNKSYISKADEIEATNPKAAVDFVTKNKAKFGDFYGAELDRVNKSSTVQDGEALNGQANQHVASGGGATQFSQSFFSSRAPGKDANLDPAFGKGLQAAVSAAEAATGQKATFTSLRRTDAEQAVLRADYEAGTGGLAAPPGHSLHGQGRAADMAPGPVRDWLKAHVAEHPEWGVEFLGGRAGAMDPEHIQSSGGSAAGGGAPSQAGGGGSFIDSLATIESGNRNVQQAVQDVNTTKGTPAGGYFQIIDPTWLKYAKTAGVDTAKYPTAMSAPRDVQVAVASVIPFSEFGPRTQTMLEQQFGTLDHNATIGELAAAHGGAGSLVSRVDADQGENVPPTNAAFTPENPPATAPKDEGPVAPVDPIEAANLKYERKMQFINDSSADDKTKDEGARAANSQLNRELAAAGGAAREIKAREESVSNDVLGSVNDGKPQDAYDKLDKARKTHLVDEAFYDKLSDVVAQRTGDPNPKYYGPGYADAVKRLLLPAADPQHISDVRQIIEMEANHQITSRGADDLTKQMGALAKSEDEAGLAAVRSEGFKALEAKMSGGSDINGGIKSPKGLEMFRTIGVAQYNRAYNDWRAAVKAGKGDDFFQLSDPKKLDAFAESIYPQRQRDADALSALGEDGALAPEAPGTPLPPAPNGVDAAGWTASMQRVPTINGQPIPHAVWGQVLSILAADPSPGTIAAFDQRFGAAKLDGQQIVQSLLGPNARGPTTQPMGAAATSQPSPNAAPVHPGPVVHTPNDLQRAMEDMAAKKRLEEEP